MWEWIKFIRDTCHNDVLLKSGDFPFSISRSDPCQNLISPVMQLRSDPIFHQKGNVGPSRILRKTEPALTQNNNKVSWKID